MLLPEAPSEFNDTLENLYKRHMLPVMPPVSAVEHIHQHLQRMHEAVPSTLFIRSERTENIGNVERMSDGSTIQWTDNAPAWAIHRAAFENKQWNAAEFDAFIQALPVRMFDAPRPSIRDVGYYVAHLLRVKDSRARAVDLPLRDRVARFVRNVHPINHFYVPNRPKGIGPRYGEDPAVIAFIASEYERRFARVWQQFIKMTHGESLQGQTSAGAMCITFSTERSADVAHAAEAIRPDGSPGPADLCIPITQAEIRAPFRRWCGDDKKGGYRHNGAVRLSESPMHMILSWRRSRESPAKMIGCYRLDLHALLAHGYIRTDTNPGEVRLQFVHDGDSIYIQHRPLPRLRVGTFN